MLRSCYRCWQTSFVAGWMKCELEGVPPLALTSLVPMLADESRQPGTEYHGCHERVRDKISASLCVCFCFCVSVSVIALVDLTWLRHGGAGQAVQCCAGSSVEVA